ncbi:CIC11C00000001195 [Sungouiella intermedia]|uniref:CIC11C00000001195 n=1 Tax=Sungouiella intermedia TaxID=45354 RepID=A0A1L0B8K5_9ASCO|nr:CIC11C00000001195 [[Candida] intermedia]
MVPKSLHVLASQDSGIASNCLVENGFQKFAAPHMEYTRLGIHTTHSKRDECTMAAKVDMYQDKIPREVDNGDEAYPMCVVSLQLPVKQRILHGHAAH